MRYVVFDLETTGLDRTKDSIIQFAAIKIEDNKVVDELNLYIQPIGNYSITPQAYIKHGINAKFLADKPTMFDVGVQIRDFFETPATVSIVTYNGTSFDIPFLVSEFAKVGIDFSFLPYKCYDAFLEEKERNGIDLGKTYTRYRGKTMDEAGLEAHNALSDVKATYSVFYAQQKIKNYDPIVMFGDDHAIGLMEFRNEIVPCFTIGKYRQLSVEFIKAFDRGYLQWCISEKCSFSKYTKDYIRSVLEANDADTKE